MDKENIKSNENLNENQNKFNFEYVLDYKKYKEFSTNYLASKISTNIILVLILVALILNIVYKNYSYVILFGVVFFGMVGLLKITGKSKISYKRYKYLNDNQDAVMNINIDDEKITLSNKNGNKESYTFDKILDIVESKNLIILKLKYNLGIIIDKSNITEDEKQKLYDFLFEKCVNVKSKKVKKTVFGLILRRFTILMYFVMLILAIVLLFFKVSKIDDYQNIYNSNEYYTSIETKNYNGYNTKILLISKNYEHTKTYIYEFGTDKDAKRNLNYWLEQETKKQENDEYAVFNKENYQKYVVLNDEKYIVLIRKDNYVFYGIGKAEYKDELDKIALLYDEVK